MCEVRTYFCHDVSSYDQFCDRRVAEGSLGHLGPVGPGEGLSSSPSWSFFKLLSCSASEIICSFFHVSQIDFLATSGQKISVRKSH